ncbi:LacI family DNA-binding transcriptional regulator [Candidatus Omnitrophota bacterium]
MTQKRIRIEDVAEAAGVSVTTVSRVINKVPTVNEANRRKVEEAVRRLKFKPHAIAQRLASGTNRTVALVIPRYEGIFHSFYAMELIRGVGSVCESLKLDLLFHITDSRADLNISSVGGVIFSDIIGNEKQLKQAQEEEVPCIVVNHAVETKDVNFVAADNVAGANAAIDHLLHSGHKRIATITGDLITQCARQRLDGYKQALNKKKIPVKEQYIIKGDYSRRSARHATEKLLTLKEPPSAIFAASDDMALEAIAVILEKNLKVPEDISVIGFDDNPASLYGPVPLTTVKQPIFIMAQEAGKELNKIISGKTKATVQKILPTELVIRDSCAHI